VAGCTAAGDDYLAAIEFAEDTQWSPASFKPDGLFNPQSMVCERPGCTPECTGDCGTRKTLILHEKGWNQ